MLMTMRLVTCPLRHYHLWRKQRGNLLVLSDDGTANANTISLRQYEKTREKINWTFSFRWNKLSLGKQERNKRNNNEHPSSSSLSSSSAAAAALSASSRRKHGESTATAALETPGKSLQSLHHRIINLEGKAGESPNFTGFHFLQKRKPQLSLSPLQQEQQHSSCLPRSLLSTINARFYHDHHDRQKARGESESDSDFLRISPQVRQAVEENFPVVILESAIITHGMPYPDNIETALRLESIIKEQGVVPATAGVIRGRLTVGLTQDEIEFLGRSAEKGKSAGGSGHTSHHHDSKRGNPEKMVKVSRRDLPFMLSHKLSGGTTVSGTIIAAVKAGISIFATGGLGGVHRGAETSFDVSADLTELGRNSICVVSAGVKSILDIGKTLEYMETQGICVAVLSKEKGESRRKSKENGSGRNHDDRQRKSESDNVDEYEQITKTAKFPSFFTAESAFTAPYAVSSEEEAASLVHSACQFQLNSGVLIAVPIPEEDSGAGKQIESAIQTALELAERKGVRGKEMTPFLLSEVNRLTGGLSLKANKHLIENNVRSASGIATHLAQLRREKQQKQHITTTSSTKKVSGDDNSNNDKDHSKLPKLTLNSNDDGESKLSLGFMGFPPHPLGNSKQNERRKSSSSSPAAVVADRYKNGHKRPVVIGGTSLDLVVAIQENEIVRDGRTHCAKISAAPGGVARNMAEALSKLGHDPVLLSAVGDDLFGRELLRQFGEMKMSHSKMKTVRDEKVSTAVYGALLNKNGECLMGMGDMDIHEGSIDPEYLLEHKSLLEKAPIVVLDGNLSVSAISVILEICGESGTPLWWEPTELRKSGKICESGSMQKLAQSGVSFMSPNLNELKNIVLKQQNNLETKFEQNFTFDPDSQFLSAEEKTLVLEGFKMFPGLEMLLLTKGSKGIAVISKCLESTGTLKLKMWTHAAPQIPTEQISSVSGAGDCLNAGFISGLLNGFNWEGCGRLGTKCAGESLRSIRNVPDAFN